MFKKRFDTTSEIGDKLSVIIKSTQDDSLNRQVLLLTILQWLLKIRPPLHIFEFRAKKRNF